MAAAKGTRPPNAGKGRKPGSLNKITRAFKEAILNVFNELGGEDHLLAWAAENPTEFYRIASRLIPHEVVGPGTHGEHLVKTVVDEFHAS